MDKSSGNIYEYEIPYDEMRMDFLLDKVVVGISLFYFG